ncbi:integrase core domain-containing protein [Leptospira santarosai]|nr:integrase core domain-containing protein [Leptospira santarosai]MDI7225208.1 integrase core domain-containing protein [Leptospira santarosai]MDI7230253.1 integrase core domain-containing protein [Leptospira santarosai]
MVATQHLLPWTFLRRECFNHIPIFSLNHAHYVAQEYVQYYNLWRPHLALNRDSPCGRKVSVPSPTSKVIKRKVLGGLHHVYFHSEAAYCSNHLIIVSFLTRT